MNGYTEVLKYFRFSVNQNSSLGQGNHSERMLEDRGCSADPATVAPYLKRAAVHREFDRAFNYGLCMFDGKDAKSDPVEVRPHKSIILMPKAILTIAGPKVMAFPAMISHKLITSNRRLTRIVRLDNSIIARAIPGARPLQ
jgi:hypothetical protein